MNIQNKKQIGERESTVNRKKLQIFTFAVFYLFQI